ncbi:MULTISPECIES: nickel ABC transporter permease subunit NikC [Dethiosulfovibrio]|uniref:Nickel ABC transporter permease subunit NikC n=2 Tax=Dethiosulfovibrio TaxID=47054 RepID=A0ABS9EQQ5_9BACT|nr:MULTISPECIES: nickel ABC transporter permease subunit NikC [Dethiosulfovibrio]MCF4114527.1 nickel ABC transporter permease subunit NikC [Dethiosulfovibrio russensis]MCF4143511.1 nickel ABC transporter permease subunit NikC [Dethiosulfovibrio marinus]MCF4145923.1 nickel ABC transporter permease subunit NikC [Dethiosulfovibrio acidaminovorans]
MPLRKTTVVGLALLALIALSAVGASRLTPWDPMEVDLAMKFAPPGNGHVLGCDHLGRDVLSRLLYGTRVSMGSVGLILGLVMGTGFVVGAAAGYFGGRVDTLLMRLCDVFLTFPTFILAMFLIGILGTGMTNVILAVAMTHWAWYARIVRSMVLSIRNRDYIMAARVSGTGHWGILFRHMMPSVFSQLAILATMDIGHMMLHVSGLSFLGLGVTPPTPEWGVMIADARAYIWTHPELMVYPGAMIFLTVMACNLLGDSLRDSLDPALVTEAAA